MVRSAAIFDLDRTLIPGSSGIALGRALRAVGLAPREVPFDRWFYAAYQALGESYPWMQLTRLGARLTAGWPVAKVQEAARAAAGELLAEVQPWARVLLEEHRERGRILVLATTTPHDFVAPFADALGFHDVVSTRYEVREGRYSGRIDGPFVWGRAKLGAVGEWAELNDVSLRECFAYSDSFYDASLLSAVAHPVAVNPDPRLHLLATLRRWNVHHLDAPPGVVKIAGRELQDLGRPFVQPALLPYARFDVAGVEAIPRRGPAILCANHRSYFDFAALVVVSARAGRRARGLAKKELFDPPVIGDFSRAIGGIPVERGSGSEEPLEDAVRALDAGELVIVLPQGTIPRGPAFFDPELRGRWGAARLAAISGAPVVPTGIWGADRVWPRNARLPHVAMPFRRPVVRVRVGGPVALRGDDPAEDTKTIMAAITDLLPPEAHRHVEPTREEIARTLPPGYHGHLEDERDRRPGVDT